MKTQRIAFQGERGAYSEDAAFHFFGPRIEPIPRVSFKAVFESVVKKECDAGIVPIENSLTGSIHQNVDLMLEFHLSVTGEIILPIRHHLLANAGVRLKDIRKVYSHPQGLQQCSRFLENLPDVEQVTVADTAGAARFVAEQKILDGAAIASSRAGRDYGLTVIKKDIENEEQNFTRFLAIAAEPVIPKHSPKTSIIFSTKDIPGALFKALSVFALRDINLFKIESRPLPKGPWKYWFYLDFEGGMEQESCRNAVRHLEEIADFVRVLGSYERGKVVE
jgi:prephenate dehydratase